MTTSQMIIATVSASDELPEAWGQMAFVAFAVGCLLACVTLVYSCFSRSRAAWFRPASISAAFLGAVALAFAAYIYTIDFVAVDGDGTRASPPIWQALAIPSLPVLASLAALTIYHRRTSLP